MAKTSGPLFSLGAHGSLSKTLNYSRRRSGDQCRKYNKPTVPATAKQRGQRRLTEFLIAQWQNMSAGDKATWAANARGTGLNLSGYHYFLRTAQRDLYTHHGLCGYWHCNEIVGGTVLDLSGNGNHGTLEPNYPSDAPTLVNSKSPRFSKALSYNGVDEYLNCGHNSSLDIVDAITMEAWIKPTNVVGAKDIIQKADSSREPYRLLLDGDDVFLQLSKDASIRNFTSIANIITINWQRVTVTYDRTDIKMYVNSIEKTIIGSAPSWPLRVTTADLIIGKRLLGDDNHCEGLIDEVCLYNRALSAAEIATRYKFAIRKV